MGDPAGPILQSLEASQGTRINVDEMDGYWCSIQEWMKGGMCWRSSACSEHLVASYAVPVKSNGVDADRPASTTG